MRLILIFMFLIFAVSVFSDEKMCDGPVATLEQLPYESYLSADNSSIVILKKDDNLVIIDFHTGEKKVLPYKFTESSTLSPNATKLITKTKNGTEVVDLKTGKKWNFKGAVTLSPDENSVVTTYDNTVIFKDLKNDTKAEKITFSGKWLRPVEFSKDSKTIFFQSDISSLFSKKKRELTFFSNDSKKKKSYQYAEPIRATSVSPKGEFAIVKAGNASMIIDLKQEAQADQEITDPTPFSWFNLKLIGVVNGIPVVADNNVIHLIDPRTGRSTFKAEIASANDANGRFNEEEGFVASYSPFNYTKTTVWNLKTKQEKEFNYLFSNGFFNDEVGPSSGVILLDQRNILGKNTYLVNPNTMTAKEIPRDPTVLYRDVEISADKTKLFELIQTPSPGVPNRVDIHNLQNDSQESITLPNNCAPKSIVKIPFDNKEIAIMCAQVKSDNNFIFIKNLETNIEREIPVAETPEVNLSSNHQFYFYKTNAPRNSFLLSRDCSPAIKIESDLNCSTCSETQPPSKDSKILPALLFQQPFNAETKPLWDKLTGDPKASTLTQTEAENWLMRFQKLDGFEPKIHAHIIESILSSDIAKKRADLVTEAMLVVMAKSPILYHELMKRNMISSSPESNQKSPCRLDEDDKKISEAAPLYFDYLKSTLKSKTEFSDWTPLIPLKSLLQKASQSKKDEIIDYIAQSLADGAADTPEFHDLFLSKLYKFTSQAANALLDEPIKPLTDMSVTRGARSLSPIILGVAPIDGDEKSKTPFGFYAKKIDSIILPKEAMNLNQKYSWKMNNKTYNVELSVQEKEKRDSIIPQGASPHYNELWKDNTFHGIVVVGTNLKESGDNVMSNYLAYYQSQGFEFPKEKTKINNLEKFLDDGISSGQADYFIKEAHSDGDEKNIFRIDQEANYLRGVKILPNGKKEVVDLVFPTESTKTKLISNEKFGEWIRNRDQLTDPKLKGNQFVFFNTSCWSKTKALHEIEAAGTKTLLDIPSLNTVLTFTNDEKSAEYQLFDSFRNGKNFEEIKKNMEKNDGFKTKSENYFIFPTDQEYDEHISSKLARPLDIKYQVKDGAGNPVNIDEIH